MTTETKDPALGRVFGGQYRIESLLGRGGMGSVYRGVQLSVNREVAIKLITAGSPNNQAELVKRFHREAKATAQLSHPNTVRLFDFGVTETQELYMVMELLEGRDLEAQLQASGALPLPVALHITRQILSALSEAHELGIVHRDLKPGNVFLSQVRGGDVIAKVMDFGVAGLEQARDTQKLTTTGAVIGTPAYMSPEQAQGKPAGARSDLYSVGVMLYEMLAGRPPFQAESIVSLLLMQVTEPVPRLAIATDEPPQLDALQTFLDRLLCKTPEGRPSSAAHALAEVDVLLARESGSQPPGVYHQGIAAAQLSATVQAQTPFTWAASRSQIGTLAMRFRDKRIAIIASVVVAVLAVGGYWAFKPSKSAPSVMKPAAATKEPVGATPHTVTIASTPSGARVVLEGANLGTTPYILKFRRDTVITVILQDYEPQTFTVTPNSDPNIVVSLTPRSATSKKSGSAATVATREPQQSNTNRNEATIKNASAQEHSPDNGPTGAATPSSSTSARRRSPVGEVTHAVGGLVRSIFGGGSGDSERSRRRAAMRNRPPPYPTEAAAKQALNAGQITSQQYSDAIWVLRTNRQQRIAAEKANLRAGKITSQEYKRRVQSINAQ
jgi:hypothetical protein